MRPITRRSRTPAIAILLGLGILPGTARAQMGMAGPRRPLGGYGAATISSYYGGGGASYLPYNGQAGGFVPYRGNGLGGGMGTQPIPRRPPRSSIGGTMMAETPIGGASLAGVMGGAGDRGGAMGSRPEGRTLVPFGYEGGIGMGSRMVGIPHDPTRDDTPDPRPRVRISLPDAPEPLGRIFLHGDAVTNPTTGLVPVRVLTRHGQFVYISTK